MGDHPSQFVDCPPGPHHHPFQAVIIFRGYAVVLDDTHSAVALAWDPTVAARLAVLLDRHGLVDVPDGLAPSWPAPTGQPATEHAPGGPPPP